jgi:hypothetical protein
MNATARRVLRGLVPVICPPEALPLTDAIVDHVALTASAMPPMLQTALATGLVTYDLSALPRYRKRAHKLLGDDAERYYVSWLDGVTPVHHQFAKLLNQLISMSCYEQPEMLAAIGVHIEPWVQEVTKKRLTVYADDIKKQDARTIAPDPLRPGIAAKKKKEVA